MPVVPLDYPKARVLLDVRTPIEAAYRAGACAKEPWTVAFVESMHRGDVLWDVGANVGSYALLAGALGFRAVAIEPIESNFAALTRNLHLNSPTLREKIMAVKVALGATNGVTTMVQQSTPGYGEGGEQGPPEGRETRDVQQVTLDDLVTARELPFPTHVKIDVDGHELGVLAGAEGTFRQATPLRALMIEVQRSLGPRVDDLLALWGWHRTATFDERNGQRIPDMTYGMFERVESGLGNQVEREGVS